MTIYTATAPDGTTKTRKSDRSYPFAAAVLLPARPAYFDKYAERERPAVAASWEIVGFSGTPNGAAKLASPYKSAELVVVVETVSR